MSARCLQAPKVAQQDCCGAPSHLHRSGELASSRSLSLSRPMGESARSRPTPLISRSAGASASSRSSTGYVCRANALAESTPAEATTRYVKVCGVTNEEDALIAASSGANLIGMILWPKAKRSIAPQLARKIAAVARSHGAAPVAVFVDEDADTIARVCQEADVDIAQLHGDGARSALPDLPPGLRTVYVMHADKAGVVQTAAPVGVPADSPSYPVDWVLLDSLQGGSGERFDWSSLNPPTGRQGWLLAGGLTPDNVEEAIGTASPSGVDVSSGVCGTDGLRKDADKVQNYVAGALKAFRVD